MFGRLRRSTLGNDSMQFEFLDSLQRWLATMVDLKISSRSIGEEVLQYLRDGFWRQFFMIVELKSWGGFKRLRSSITDADRVAETENEIVNSRMTKVAEMEAMEKFLCCCLKVTLIFKLWFEFKRLAYAGYCGGKKEVGSSFLHVQG